MNLSFFLEVMVLKLLAEFKEPLIGYEQKPIMVLVKDLSVIEIQRKPSSYRVKRLAESMRKIGFTTSMIAVEKDGRCIIIDGQHRLFAAKAGWYI
ncbi:MAG: ParB N-terminal domain-containing protein [Candidatus Bathyarchaeota archaeon]|nr:ParB N-terminal domain-containing protein [Candidatus Bathyarchaeota archaeon]